MEKVRAFELKVGDCIERYSYERGMTWEDEIIKIEPYTWPNGKEGFRITWKRGCDGYKSILCIRTTLFKKTA